MQCMPKSVEGHTCRLGTVVEEAVKRAKKNQKRVMPRCIAFRPAAVVPTLVQWTRTSGTIVS